MPQIAYLRDATRFALWLRRVYALVMSVVVLMPTRALPSLAACPDAEELQEEAALRHGQLEQRIIRRERFARSDVGYSVNGRVPPPIHVSRDNYLLVGADGVTRQQYCPHLACTPLRL